MFFDLLRPLALGFTCALFLTAGVKADDHMAADLVVRGGPIRSGDAWVEAMAIRGGTIVMTGDAQDVQPYVGQETTVLALGGNTVLPGIHDMHLHGLFAGLEQSQCGLRPGAGPQEIIDAVRACVAAASPGEWIVGGNWVGAVFAQGTQTKEMLDQVSPNNPVILGDESHHSAWVNTRALERAGISSDTPDPPGGVIEKGADGAPNGLLRETATSLVEDIVPEPSMEARLKALKWSTQEMLSFGITSFMDASIRQRNIEVYAQLADSGDLKQRVRGCIVWEARTDETGASSFDVSEGLISQRNIHARANYHLDCVKIFMDGVPTESRTGAMLKPYVDHHGHMTDERGILMIEPALVNGGVARFDRQGLMVKFHAAGDGAVRASLDAVEYARQQNGWGGPVHHVGHSTFISKNDIPRAKELNAAWEFSPYIWYPTPMVAVDIAGAVGDKRMERWMPIREALDTKALVVAGSDWSVVPSVNPWLAIETMVTRQMPGGSDEAAGKREAVSREEAIEIMTVNGAAMMRQRDKVGTLEVGMKADFVVLPDNPYEMALYKLHTLRAVETYIDGKRVYRQPSEN